MQKGNIQKDVHTQDEQLNKANNPTNLTDVASSENIQTDTIPQSTKTKAGSRFISAIRKISGSSKNSKQAKLKGEKDKIEGIVVSTEDEEIATPINPVSSTQNPEGSKKKKTKFSKRLLGSRSKSKRKHLNEESTEISKTSEIISEYEHSIKTSEKADATPAASVTKIPQPTDRIQKVQITISGKKIEHTKIDHKQGSITRTTTQITGGSRSEKEYLLHDKEVKPTITTIPITTSGLPTLIRECDVGAPKQRIVKANDDLLTLKKNKKFETKKQPHSDETESQTLTHLNKRSETTHNTTATTAQEPISLKSTTATNTRSGVKEIHTPTKFTSERLIIVTESTHDTPPSVKAPAKPSCFSEYKTAKRGGIVVPQKPTATLDLQLTSNTEDKTQRSCNITSIKSAKDATSLMQNPLEIAQRGHRLPKPTNITNLTTTLPTTLKPTAETENTLQLDSQANKEDSDREQQPVSQSIEAKISASVVTESANSQDEVDFSGKSDNLPIESTGINFAVGSIVRAPQKLVSLDIDLDQDLDLTLDSVGSNISSDSQTPISDSSRKRLRYIPKPSLTQEDFNSGDNWCEEILFPATISRRAYTLDSDTEDHIENPQMPAFGDLTMDQEMEPVRRLLIFCIEVDLCHILSFNLMFMQYHSALSKYTLL